MRFRLGSLFQKNAHPWSRRLYFAWRQRIAAVFSKRQSVHFVEINGKRYKRVTLGDSYEAVLVERALAALPAGAGFPALIHRHENELLIAYIEGRKFDAAADADQQALARFLGAVYRTRQDRTGPERLQRRLEVDLSFLFDTGLIDAPLRDALARRADQIRPGEIVTGLDYVDPVEKNFVVRDGAVHAVDIESLRDGIALGTGIARAAIHWLRPDKKGSFIDQVEAECGLTLTGQLPYLELCDRVGWTKRKLLQGKHGSINVERLREIA